jgi:hypothetical protein
MGIHLRSPYGAILLALACVLSAATLFPFVLKVFVPAATNEGVLAAFHVLLSLALSARRLELDGTTEAGLRGGSG